VPALAFIGWRRECVGPDKPESRLADALPIHTAGRRSGASDGWDPPRGDYLSFRGFRCVAHFPPIPPPTHPKKTPVPCPPSFFVLVSPNSSSFCPSPPRYIRAADVRKAVAAGSSPPPLLRRRSVLPALGRRRSGPGTAPRPYVPCSLVLSYLPVAWMVAGWIGLRYGVRDISRRGLVELSWGGGGVGAEICRGLWKWIWMLLFLRNSCVVGWEFCSSTFVLRLGLRYRGKILVFPRVQGALSSFSLWKTSNLARYPYRNDRQGFDEKRIR
jgi:hypothetical protein